MDEKVFLPKLKTALETGEKAKISVNVTNLNRSWERFSALRSPRGSMKDWKQIRSL